MFNTEKIQEQASIPDDAETVALKVRLQRLRGKARVAFPDLRGMNLPSGTESKIAETISERLDMRHVPEEPIDLGTVTVRVSDGKVVEWNIDWDIFDK